MYLDKSPSKLINPGYQPQLTHLTPENDHLERLKKLYIFESAVKVFEFVKNKPGINSVVQLVQRCSVLALSPAASALQLVSGYFPQRANSLCNKAVDCAETIAVDFAETIDRYCVQGVESASKVTKVIKANITKRAVGYTDRLVNTPVGYFILQLVDLQITIMTSVLSSMQPDENVEEKGRLSRDTRQSKKQLPQTSIEKMTDTPGIISKITNIITFPLRILLSSLWFLRNRLMPYRKDKSDFFSPTKTFISNRRRLSPVKKAQSKNFIRRFIVHTLGFLGIRPMNRLPKHRIKFINPQKLYNDDDDDNAQPEKRRFSDVSEESFSDEDVNYLDEGMEDYISEEDPDFEPTGEMSDDSYEFEEGDTESFIELEDEKIESPGKRTSKTSTQAIRNNEPKSEKKSQREQTPDKANKTGKKELKIDLKRVEVVKEKEKKKSSKSEKFENKENKEPEKPKAFSPTKAVSALRPQNASSPVLKPEWQKLKPASNENKEN